MGVIHLSSDLVRPFDAIQILQSIPPSRGANVDLEYVSDSRPQIEGAAFPIDICDDSEQGQLDIESTKILSRIHDCHDVRTFELSPSATRALRLEAPLVRRCVIRSASFGAL